MSPRVRRLTGEYVGRGDRPIPNRPQVTNLFECIRTEMRKGSPEGYNAETGFCEPAQKPQPGEPNEHQSLYRIRRSQEKCQLLCEDSRRKDRRGGHAESHARKVAPVGAKAAGGMAAGDGSAAVERVGL